MPKRALKSIHRFFLQFAQAGALSGILLFLATFIALLWANLPGGHTYHEFWHEVKFTIGFKAYGLNITKDLLHWINDGLMAIFFFVIGLEIKREILIGELSSWKKASLPLIAALGGVVLPALIYVGFNYGTPALDGWGIPMATDIAFAIGILALLGDRVPTSLKVFLVALAVVDDIAAVLVIALFYSSSISLMNLGIGAICLLTMIGMNLANVRRVTPYAVIGIGGLWLAFLLSGVHATIAGVLAAFTIPTSVNINPISFKNRLSNLVKNFEEQEAPPKTMLSHQQQATLSEIEREAGRVEPPLQKLERYMYPWAMYFVMPIFALSNAGITITQDVVTNFINPVSLGVMLGLVIGKSVGITVFSWIGSKLGILNLPSNVRWIHIIGLALLAGVGFTMSLFISGLAFSSAQLSEMSKAGILAGSLVSGLSGYFLLRSTLSSSQSDQQ